MNTDLNKINFQISRKICCFVVLVDVYENPLWDVGPRYFHCERMEILNDGWTWEIGLISKIIKVYLRSLTFFPIYLLLLMIYSPTRNVKMSSRILRLCWVLILMRVVVSSLVVVGSTTSLPSFLPSWPIMISLGSVSILSVMTLREILSRWWVVLCHELCGPRSRRFF